MSRLNVGVRAVGAVTAAVVAAAAWQTAPSSARPSEASGMTRGHASARVQGMPAIRSENLDEQSTWTSVSRADRTVVAPMPGARIVFVPHHAPAGHLAASAIRDLSKTALADARSSWQRVVVIGPDHDKAGATAAATCAAAWHTPFGRVEGDASAHVLLATVGAVTESCDLLAHEHSMGEIVPYVARNLPGATVVPLAVRADANWAERRQLLGALREIVDQHTVVVVSVDLAHGVPPHVARWNDGETVAALESFDTASIAAFGDEHLDAPAATLIAMALAEDLGATRFVLRERTDGSELPGFAGTLVTSYIAGYYAVP